MRAPIYLDNAATTARKPESVYKAVNHALRYVSANPGRSGHRLSIEAARIVFEARQAVAELIGAKDSSRVVFTANCTESVNTVLKGFLRPGDEVATTSMEHNSVARPLRFLEQEIGLKLKIVQCDRRGNLDRGDIAKAISKDTRLVVMLHGSNVTGTVFPIEDVVSDAHRKGVPVLVDAAQTAGFWEIDVGKTRIDFLAFSGHKALYGPQGTGCLYVAEGHDLKSLKHGGTGSRSEEDVHPRFLPDRLEAGTPNTPGIAGLAAGVRFVAQEGIRTIQKHEINLTHDIMRGLGRIAGVRVYGPLPGGLRCPVISFTIEGMDNGAVAMRLEREFGVMCRSGLQCAPWAHRTIGTCPHGTLRFSPGFFNTNDDVVTALDAVRAIAKG